MLSSFLERFLNDYLNAYQPKDYLLESAVRKTHLSARTCQAVFTNTMHKSGITKKASFHSWRHSFATNLHAMGYDLRTIQKLLVHKISHTMKIYTHVSNKHLSSIKSPLDNLNLLSNLLIFYTRRFLYRNFTHKRLTIP